MKVTLEQLTEAEVLMVLQRLTWVFVTGTGGGAVLGGRGIFFLFPRQTQ